MSSVCIMMLLAVPAVVAQLQDPCACAGTDRSGQYRTWAKHRRNWSHYPQAARTIGPADLIAWQKVYAAQTDTVTRSLAASRLRRLRKTPEDTLYTLKGYLYFIKKESDCDYHAEIGPADPSAPRAVVEFTTDYCGMQRRILRYIRSHVRTASGRILKERNLREEFSPGIPVTVRGLGFYDGWHEPGTHGRAATHGSSWELHPAVRITFGN